MPVRFVFPVLLGVFGVAVLSSLGTWQIQRLQWKLDVLKTIEARVNASPVSIPMMVSEAADNYLAVEAVGELTGDEVYVLSSLQGFGPGYRVVAAFKTGERRIMLDLGFFLESVRSQSISADQLHVAGNLHWPDETDSWFTPQPDGDLWFARDVKMMSGYLETEPILLVARRTNPAIEGSTPLPVNSAGVPNNHLNYAITWFLMAIAWCGMTLYWVWRIRHKIEDI